MEEVSNPPSTHTKLSFRQDTDIPAIVTRFLPQALIEREVQAFGLVRRQRKVSLVPLVWTLLFATLATPNASMSHWHRLSCTTLGHWLQTLLPGLEGVFALDSSTVALRDELPETWKACAKAKSALKLHAVINVLSLQPHSTHLSHATLHDSQRLMRMIKVYCACITA